MFGEPARTVELRAVQSKSGTSFANIDLDEAGIGAAVCKMLSDHGVKVVGCARRVDRVQELSRTHPNIRAYECDVTNEEEVKKLFEFVEADPELGKVDICVANAGYSTKSSLLEGTVKASGP